MDTLPPGGRSDLMRRVRVRDTGVEILVRRYLHAKGYRFRIERQDLPGRPDIVLPKWRTAIFVHGCFWHGCKKCDRGLRIPKTNRAFWIDKIAANCIRDQRVARELKRNGWRVITIWECQTKSEASLGRQLRALLRLRETAK
jgi:DNA mismatch endonuclease (patch repair protein)